MFHSARLTRRQFLKLGALSAGIVASGVAASRSALAGDLIQGGQSVSRTTGHLRPALASSCALCGARCGILGFIEEGRLVKIEGNPRDPNSRGRLCARGHAGINRLYDPDRVLFPMERQGRRGEGKWKRISWEEAYQKLEERLTAVQGKDPEALALHSGAEGVPLLARRFLLAAGSHVLIDEVCLQDSARRDANRTVMGTDGEVVDVARTRFLVNFGGNPYETHPVYVPFVQRLVDARMAGARLVTFDPRMSLTAGRSDEWFPVTPGSDGLVCMAMAHTIVQQGLHDLQFLSSTTDLSSDDLAAQLAPYTPEIAAAASGVPADDIRRLATEFARVRPAVAIYGGGVGRQAAAAEVARAVLLLNALVGSIGVPGAHNPQPAIHLPEPSPEPSQDTLSCSDATRFVEELLDGRRRPEVYITALANPAFSWPDSDTFRHALEDESRIGYFVAIDTNLTETSSLADMVLPAATYLESWGLETPAAQDLVPFIAVRQPVVRPRGESISVDDVLLTLGTRLREPANQFFPFPTVESYVNAVVSGIPEVVAAGGLARLREHGVWYDSSRRPRYRSAQGGFETASGRLQLASMPTLLVGNGPDLPVQLSTATSEPEAQDLILVPFRPNVHFGEYSTNLWWLSEIAHSNLLLVNPATARQKRIQQGQSVKVTSRTGSLQARVRVTHSVHPQVVALALGFGHQAVGKVARAERFLSDDPMTSLIWWGGQGNGTNPSPAISGKESSAGGGLAWTNTRVKIEALG